MNDRNKKEEEQYYIPAQLREKLKSNNRQELHALKDAGALSDKGLSEILFLKNSDMDAEARRRWIKRVKEHNINRQINEAVNSNDYGYQSHAVGINDSASNMTSYKRIKQLRDVVIRAGRTFVFKGEPDAGKTNFSLFLAELAADFDDRTLLTNMRSVERGKTFHSFKQMEKLAEKEKKTFIIIEDASNHLSGYNTDSSDVEEYMRPFQNELAKNDAVMCLLGHTGMDVHAHLRRNAFLVDKTGKKSATVYENVNGGSGGSKIASFNNISKTEITYDPKEKTAFKFPSDSSDDGEKERETIIKKVTERLKNNRTVKTVDLPEHNNEDVATVLRDLADRNDGIKFSDSSPKSIKRRRKSG